MKQHHIFLSFFIFTCTALCSQTQKIQPAHLAGSWYPKNKTELNKNLDYYFSLAEKHFPISNKNEVSALIVPHASYHFSGLCAASAYQAIQEEKFDRVIILGPSHKKKFSGIALPDYKAYKTPLGTIAVDTNAVNLLAKKNRLFKTAIPDIWQTEHSVEIQLPFLQFCLTNFEIIPLIIGNLTEKEFTTAAQQLGALLTESKKTLIIVSSDFIHYGKLFKYTPGIKKAEQFNTQAIKAILNKSYKEFNQIIIQTGATICGQSAIKILLRLIEQNALGHVECTLSSLYNSAQIKNSYKNKKIDVANLKKPVDAKSFVSYAGIVCTTKLTRKEKDSLLLLARYAITKKLFPKKILPIDKFKQTNNLEKPLGAFVTLKTKSGKLRGCIGTITTNEPLYKTIIRMAQAAAFNDSRFLPLKKNELDDIKLSITILTTPHSVKNHKDIVLGKHGIILEKTIDGIKKSAVYLPQVAPEQGWNLTQTLESLSKKAGLDKNGWKQSKFKVFEGFEFGE